LFSLFALIVPGGAHAEPFTIPFQLTVDVNARGTDLLFGTTVPAGTTITGAWTFDRTLQDQNTNPDEGFYADPKARLILNHGTRSFQVPTASGALIIQNDVNSPPTHDDLQIFGGSNGVGGWSFLEVEMLLSADVSRFSSDTFPTSIAELNGISGFGSIVGNRIGFREPCEECSQMALFGPMRIIDSAPVPEPSTLLLMGTGLAAFGRDVWKRRRGARAHHQMRTG
jgi:PEP-CTERM motif-containing protein